MENKDALAIARLRDPKSYLEKFTKIKGKEAGKLIPFILNRSQLHLFNNMRKYTRIMILKARQLGFSSGVTGFFYHNTITTPGITTALIGYNSDLTAEILDKIKTLYKTTPAELRPTIHYNSKYEISFPRLDSKILVLPSSENVGRGYTIHQCLVTELSSWEKAEEKMMQLEASVPINGKLVIESCVTGETLILTSQGFRYIEDMHDWKQHGLGFSEGKNIKLDGHYDLKPTSTYYNSGVRKGVKIKTRKGYELGMSSVHKIFALKNGKLEFVKAKDMKVGDILTMKYGQELWGSNDKIDWEPSPYGFNKKNIEQFSSRIITKDLAYLIGLILGDGSIYKNDKLRVRNVTIATVDEEVSTFLLNNKLGLKFVEGKGENYYHYRCTNKSFVEFLQDYVGFENGVKAPGKKIPKIVLKWSRDNVVAFLQGLFDADGCCRKDRKEVSFTSTSKKIIYVLQSLLLNFGIISQVFKYNAKPSKLVKVWSKGYKLEINKAHSGIFLKKIGFRIKRKQENNAWMEESYSCLQEFVPGIGKVIKKEMVELGLKYSDIAHGLNKGLFSKSGNITYRVLDKIIKKCRNKNSEEYKKLEKLSSYKYHYEEIKEITLIEENVYDFTVEDGHTVIYNGFVGHQTPRGVGNLYHRMWMADNDYRKLEYGWWWGYSQKEINIIERRMNNPQMFAQEYGLDFIASGRPAIPTEIMKRMRPHIKRVGDEFKDKEGVEQKVYVWKNLRIYSPPKPDHFYVMGVDTSEGIEGGDYSSVIVFDRATGEEVAFYRGLVAPDILGEWLDTWGRWYNNALIVVEVNNHGLTTLTILKQKIYPTLYFRPARFETIASPTSDKLGWKTTKMTKPLMIDDLVQAMREGVLLIHSKELIDEMTIMVYNDNGDVVAIQGYNDDCFMGCCICFQGFKVMYHKKLTQLDYTEHLPSNFTY